MGGMGGIGFTAFFCEYAFKGVKRPFLQRKTGIFGLPKGHCGNHCLWEIETYRATRIL